MAEVARDPAPDERQGWIDEDLAYLTHEWAALPDLAGEWEGLGQAERLDFVLEWPLREERLRDLRRWAEIDWFTPEQRRCYDELLDLIARHRPILARLLRDEIA